MKIQKKHKGWTIWWGDNKPIWKSLTFNYHAYWLKKLSDVPFFWYHNNGAVKGVDSCLDVTLKIGPLYFCYTDWSYGRFRKVA